ncbi:Chromatin modification-related protein eaf3 [Penicillium longicatenatum]|nr:Chromatin modification-related protein eaf3 [Penicillium longicatenatum]
MAPTNYAKDEKVLCFHHDILYEAKILDVRHKDSSDKKSPFEYLVHYKGWKNTWDDWVLEDRLRKWSDENRELAANIRRDAEASLRAKNVKPGSATKKRAMSERSSVRDSEERGNSVSGRGNKRARDNDIERGYRLLYGTVLHSLCYGGITLPAMAYNTATDANLLQLMNAIRGASTEDIPGHTQQSADVALAQTSEDFWKPVRHNGVVKPKWIADLTSEQEESFQARPSIRIVMPDNLKSLIVDDWERVTKNASVVQLPHDKSVYQILQDWRADEVPKRHPFDISVMDEIIAGLSEYFEVVIDKLLLYRYERHQYRVLKKRFFGNKEKTPLHVYGAEHLIRLLSILPELLAQTNMEYKSTGRSHEELSKFAIWLSRNSEKYFPGKYVLATEVEDEE